MSAYLLASYSTAESWRDCTHRIPRLDAVSTQVWRRTLTWRFLTVACLQCRRSHLSETALGPTPQSRSHRCAGTATSGRS